VNDQSGMVDDISNHIERTADRTRDANVQLRKVRSGDVPHDTH
jgi:SNARE domain